MEHYSTADLENLRRTGVGIEIADWMFGDRPDRARHFAGWDLHDETKPWRVRNVESVRGDRPHLVKVSRLGTALDPSNRAAYLRLLKLERFDHLFDDKNFWQVAVAQHEQLANQYPDNLAALLTSYRTLIAAAPHASDLPDLAATIMGEWLAGGGIPNASMHLVEISDQLGNRYGMPRALLHHTKPSPTVMGTAFASSLELIEDIVMGLSAYLEPLVTSLSPSTWGSLAVRAGGVVLLAFGAPVNSRGPLVVDILSMSGRRVRLDDIGQEAPIPPQAFRDAIAWWTSRLDLVFSQITEPSNYEVEGLYNAPSALERSLNFEQICRSCQVIATTDDEHSRRLALFHVLDSLGGLQRSLDWSKLTSLHENRKLVDDLRSQMPHSVQLVLMPRAEAAVEALEQVQDGFFLPSRRTATGFIRPDKHNVETEVPIATAASEWLRVIRNSQHGYDKTPTSHDRALLAAHTGHIPGRLPDLAWLNLLRILTFPEILKRHPR
ncbi:hypothetical protein GCM10027413_24450 [Conyzicola nivalis]|uniref:Uncharacterized protein n=1 Tax=Conyzicola nivalis TaxID=1477021 RepID=A0A916SCG4_9MICO|nr:hypothetical protein [Conyzicola nivalis]GGA91055.1 hypothetical protein GCM10010979_02170 [Conyzicola nivalis]